jgi:hypothetical protein
MRMALRIMKTRIHCLITCGHGIICLPYLGGDFNLVRGPEEKSNERINSHNAFIFNDWINKYGLLEFLSLPIYLIIGLITNQT